MTEPFQRLRDFLSELKRRNVYRVAATYAAVAFVTLQAARLVFPATTLEGGVYDVLVVLAFVGFPLAVVLAWAFEVSPEGVRRTARPEGEGEEGERTATAYRVLVGIGLVAAAVAGGWYLTGGGGGDGTEIADRTVAVLPFQVSGEGTDTWREGMVTVLSTGLDGAAGLRAIADRSVLSAWDRTEGRRSSGSRRSLATARRVGARYAVLGSAVRLGPEIRFTASVQETSSGDQLGQVEVRGRPDSVTALADELTRRVLGVLLEEGDRELPSVDLGTLTSRSAPALKAFLRGEYHFRRGDFEEAVPDYREAVAADSAFAFAHWRLARANGWMGGTRRDEEERRHRERAHALAGQLPRRERRLVRADYLLRGQRPLAAADTLRAITRAYPDDADAWYLLGEASLHYGVPPGWPAADRAFGRAVALDSGFTPYHRHRVDLGFGLHRDSGVVADRVDAYPNLTGEEPRLRLLRALVFGDSAVRARTLARLDTMPTELVNSLAPIPLLHPVSAEVFEAVVREEADRGDSPVPLPFLREALVVISAMHRGRMEEAVRRAEELELRPAQRACPLAFARSVGLPLADTLRPRALRGDLLETEGRDLTASHVACIALDAAARGRWPVFERAMSRLRSRSGEGGAAGEGRPVVLLAVPFDPGGVVTALEGYAAWKRGEPRRALRLFREASVWEWRVPTGLWMGALHRELGNPDRAAEWYRGSWNWPLAHLRLGHLHRARGEPERAAAAYRRFLAAWEDADERLRDRVRTARKHLRELADGGEDG